MLQLNILNFLYIVIWFLGVLWFFSCLDPLNRNKDNPQTKINNFFWKIIERIYYFIDKNPIIVSIEFISLGIFGLFLVDYSLRGFYYHGNYGKPNQTLNFYTYPDQFEFYIQFILPLFLIIIGLLFFLRYLKSRGITKDS